LISTALLISRFNKREISVAKIRNKGDKENLACAKPVALAEALVALILS